MFFVSFSYIIFIYLYWGICILVKKRKWSLCLNFFFFFIVNNHKLCRKIMFFVAFSCKFVNFAGKSTLSTL